MSRRGLRSARALALLGSAFAALPAAAPAQSRPRTCGPEVVANATLNAPAEVAHGREGVAYLDAVASDVDVSFAPATPTGTLSTAYARRFPAFERWPVSFARGDDPALLRATYEEAVFTSAYAPDYRCLHTLEAAIRPVEGETPGVARTVDYGTTLVIKLRGSGECIDMRTGAITFRVRGGRSRRDLRLSDVCGNWRVRSVPDFKARFVNEDEVSYPLLELEPRERSVNARRRYSVTAMFRGRRLRTVRFGVRWEYTPRRRIDQAEDDFVNVCINDPDIRIWKRNGRLYCIEPADRAVHVRLLP